MASAAKYSCLFVSKHSTIFPKLNNNKMLQMKVLFIIVNRYRVLHLT
jgi:hypothetical protein